MKTFYFAAIFLSASALSAETLRVATFNAALNRRNAGDLLTDMTAGDEQVAAIAEIIQRVQPDILLLNEFDYDPDALAAFQKSFLSRPQNTTGVSAAQPVHFPFSFIAPSNTGVPSGYDLDGSQEIGGPGDAYGYGYFPGQYGMVVLSKYPIDQNSSRTFQNFLWNDMPDHLIPMGFYSDEAVDHLRLSSKSHWDVAIDVNGMTLHLLAAHPTPPVFDGQEDRNGRRNHDEIRFLADYVRGADYIYDDAGRSGGLAMGAHFIIAGDMNADPFDGDSTNNAVMQLLDHPLINGSADDAARIPASNGGQEAAVRQSGFNAAHRANPAFDTADFGYDRDNPGVDRTPGNLRVDYVLPSRTLRYRGGGVFWLQSAAPLHKLAEWPTSDHRLVWIDVEIPD